MENKKILMSILLASIVMLSGCAVKEYFESFVVTPEDEANFSLLSEKDDYVNDTGRVLGELIEDGERLKITVEEDDTVVLMPEGEDADMDEIMYTFTSPLDEEGAWKTNYGDAGKYIVTVTASDGELATSKEVLIEVLRKNVPPVITGIPDDLVIDEGDVIKVMPNVTDPNGDAYFDMDTDDWFFPLSEEYTQMAYDIIKESLTEGVTVFEALKNGDPHQKVDLAFIAEGYAKSEEKKFRRPIPAWCSDLAVYGR